MSADNPPLRDDDITTSQGGSTGAGTGDRVDQTDAAGRDTDGRDADGTDRADGVDGTDTSDSPGGDADGSDISDSGLGGDADSTDR
jgi:hypothetical protein